MVTIVDIVRISTYCDILDGTVVCETIKKNG